MARPRVLFGSTECSTCRMQIEDGAGKRTLHIGRTEGDSRRVYATIPGSNAVFIIGETESQRLLRPMAEFVAAETK